MGGVGILWREEIQRYIQPVKDYGNERVVAITLRHNDTHMGVINVYMPSGNNKATKEKYLDTLAVIIVLIHKYQSSHFILLMGDFNMDPFKEH